MEYPEAEWLTTKEAAALLKVSLHTVQSWIHRGEIHAQKDIMGHLQLPKVEVFALAQKRPMKIGRPPAPITPESQAFADKLLVITEGKSPEEIVRNLELPPNASMRQVTAGMQKRIAALIFKHRAIETLVAGLYSEDENVRRMTAESLINKMVPNLKAVEMQHSVDESTAFRQERALKVLEEIAAQGRLRQINHPVRVIEPEEGEIVG